MGMSIGAAMNHEKALRSTLATLWGCYGPSFPAMKEKSPHEKILYESLVYV